MAKEAKQFVNWVEGKRKPQYVPSLPEWKPTKGDGSTLGIDVNEFAGHYNVTNEGVLRCAEEYPTLVYLFGRTQPQWVRYLHERVTSPLGQGGSADNPIVRPVSFLVEGSGMFGLTDRDDALRWRGIFRHIVGAAVHTHYIARRFQELSEVQKEQFAERGYDYNSFNPIDPDLFVLNVLSSHGGRRMMDERKWHGKNDFWHRFDTSWQGTELLYTLYNVDPRISDLLRTEKHLNHLVSSTHNNIFPDISDNIIAAADWTFSNRPVSLEERFAALQKAANDSKITNNEILDVLIPCANNFKQAVQDIIDPNFFIHLLEAPRPEWDVRLKDAYAASAGLSLDQVF